MKELRDQAKRLFMRGVCAADPGLAVAQALRADPLRASGGTVYVVAVGKAARNMAAAAMELVPGPFEVLVVTNYENATPLTGATVLAAGHPVPDDNGAAAAQAIVSLLRAAGKKDQILALISGGGSALIPAPIKGVTIAEKAEVSRLLLASGADISQMNLVRQQLSRLKGGGFLRLASPAPVRALVLSDVVGDDVRVIASGLTATPLGTGADARKILDERGIWSRLPASVRAVLSAPDPGNRPVAKADNQLVGSNSKSLAAMAELASEAKVFPKPLVGDVKDACQQIMAFSAGSGVFLFGGETTVILRGDGKGGRNQELALRMALAADSAGWSRDWAFLSGGTDGRDGPTDAAGGLVDAGSVSRMVAAGVDPQASLLRNDSYNALKKSGDLLITGATGTNVADLQILIRM